MEQRNSNNPKLSMSLDDIASNSNPANSNTNTNSTDSKSSRLFRMAMEDVNAGGGGGGGRGRGKSRGRGRGRGRGREQGGNRQQQDRYHSQVMDDDHDDHDHNQGEEGEESYRDGNGNVHKRRQLSRQGGSHGHDQPMAKRGRARGARDSRDRQRAHLVGPPRVAGLMRYERVPETGDLKLRWHDIDLMTLLRSSGDFVFHITQDQHGAKTMAALNICLRPFSLRVYPFGKLASSRWWYLTDQVTYMSLIHPGEIEPGPPSQGPKKHERMNILSELVYAKALFVDEAAETSTAPLALEENAHKRANGDDTGAGTTTNFNSNSNSNSTNSSSLNSFSRAPPAELVEVCRRNSWAPPRYKEIRDQSGLVGYAVILPKFGMELAAPTFSANEITAQNAAAQNALVVLNSMKAVQ